MHETTKGVAETGAASLGEYLMLLLIKDAFGAALDCWSFTCCPYFDHRGASVSRGNKEVKGPLGAAPQGRRGRGWVKLTHMWRGWDQTDKPQTHHNTHTCDMLQCINTPCKMHAVLTEKLSLAR